MRIKKKTLVGRIDDKGNLIAPFQLLGDFCNLNKGRSVIIRIEIQPQEASEKLRNYVFGYVVPEMQRILHENGEDYTREQTFNYLPNEPFALKIEPIMQLIFRLKIAVV